MTKLLTTLINLNDYEKIKEKMDGLILGVKNLTVEYPAYTKEELHLLLPKLKQDNKEIFLALNKNFHNQDLQTLEEILQEFDTKVDGFLYYDVAVVNIKEKNHLKTPLLWAQEHLTTNALTSDYWYSFGATYTFVSGELTLEEIKEMKKNSQAKLIVPIFGRIPMMVSKRHLVKNYHTFFQIPYEKGMYEIKKEGNTYPIFDEEYGTVVYSGHYLNGFCETFELPNIDYFYCNPITIPFSIFEEILTLYYNRKEEFKQNQEQKIDQLLKGNTDKGFLYKETVYKVK